ncbi:MAG: SDR family NAD(P)-dependent oxidoreductase [Pseudomonadales bacterium]
MKLRKLFRKQGVTTVWAQEHDLSGKHIIVTGCAANSLGYATVKTLASWGALVVVTTRSNTHAALKQLKGELLKANKPANIDGHNLDLSDWASVNQFTDWYREHYGSRLDVLVNNAGIHLDLMSKWKEPTLTADGHEIHWRTNYLGTVQLTHNLLPLLQKTGTEQGDARVVNVVSQLHNRGSNDALFDENTAYNSWKFYGLSKLAMIHHSFEINRRFSGSHELKGYSLHPGGRSGVHTNVAAKGLETGPKIISALQRISAPVGKLFMASPEEGAQTQIHCATAPSAEGGRYYQECAEFEASADCTDQGASIRLWDETLEWISGQPK